MKTHRTLPLNSLCHLPSLAGLAWIGLVAPLPLSADVPPTGGATVTSHPSVLEKVPAARPNIGWARHQEDWSVLRDSGPTEFLDPVKYIPFNREGDMYLSLGGQVRQRVEVWNNFGFSSSNDDTFLLSRYQLHGDLHVTRYFRLFAEGIHSHIPDNRSLPGGHRAAVDVNEFDLLHLFAEVEGDLGDARLTLRAGRQPFYFGSQRLISSLPWANNYRRWDAITSIVEYKEWTLTGFFGWLVNPVEKYETDDLGGDQDRSTWGLYAAHSTGWDLYYLGNSGIDGLGDGTSHTLGARHSGHLGDSSWDYEIEAAAQILDSRLHKDAAWLLGGHLRHTWKDIATTPSWKTGVEIGSADFDQIYPLGHAYFGFTDVLGRRNLIDWNNTLSATVLEKLKLSASHHLFFRLDENRPVGNVGGGLFRPGTAAASSSAWLGHEIDFTAAYPVTGQIQLSAGYSHFFAGDFIDQTGPGSDIDFFYTQILIRF